MASLQLVELLQAVAAAEVEALVIGMLAGVLQGVPTMTLDVDLLHRRTPQNVAKLGSLLDGLDARYRGAARNPGPEQLIHIKERTGRPKDLAALPMLRAALEEARARSQGDRG